MFGAQINKSFLAEATVIRLQIIGVHNVSTQSTSSSLQSFTDTAPVMAFVSFEGFAQICKTKKLQAYLLLGVDKVLGADEVLRR